jgi:hypothetical protein
MTLVKVENPEVHLEPGEMYIHPVGKVNRFLMHWKQGRQEHFPICCIFRFSLEGFFDDGKIKLQSEASSRKRGSIDRGNGNIFVPCGIFHRSMKTESQEKLPV